MIYTIDWIVLVYFSTYRQFRCGKLHLSGKWFYWDNTEMQGRLPSVDFTLTQESIYVVK